MKTPEEIKKGLECCSISHDYCGTECPYNCYANGSAKLSLLKDALAYIQQLEREKDAAVADLRIYAGCKVCKFGDLKFPNDCMDCIRMCNWQWRGVCAENTKED